MSGRLRLRVLGPVELADSAGRSVALSGRLRRLLTALLVAEGDLVSSDRLALVLWGDELPANPEAALHNLVSRLRSRLGSIVGGSDVVALRSRSPGYVLEVDPEVLDASAFTRRIQQAQTVLEKRPTEAAELLQAAIGLWRGAAYAEFADEAFARPEADRLEQLKVSAAEDLAEAWLAAGDAGAAVGHLERLVVAEPLRERPHRQLMIALYRSGRQADALAVARRYRDRLVEELGLDPSPDLLALEQQLLRHDVEPAPTAAPGSTRPAVSPPPGAPAALVGRDHDLTELAETIRPGLLVTLVGPGGVGKTSLARQVAWQLAPSYPDGASLMELAAVSADADVARAVSTVLGLQPRSDVAALDRVVEALQGQRRLLLLDNCEHVLDGCADLVEGLLDRCPGVAVVATSRSPLEITGEQIWAVSPLPANAALRLFESRARLRNRTFEVNAANAAEVAEICRRLDRLPLAIELAAARMSAMSPAELLSVLSWRFSVLHENVLVGGRRADGRHKTLRAVVDWSYAMLDLETRFVFDVLSVFAGSFSMAEANSVLAAAAQALDRPRPSGTAELLTLIDRSMITTKVEGRVTRYVYLETLRGFGRERLGHWDPGMVVRRAHAQIFTQLAVDAGRGVFESEQQAAVAAVDAAFDEMRAAWTWTVRHEPALAARLVGSLNYFLEVRLVSELKTWADQTVDALDRSGTDIQMVVETIDGVRLVGVSAAAARFAGDLVQADTLATSALSQSAGDTEVEAYLRYLLMEVALFRGDLTDVDHHAAASPRPRSPMLGTLMILTQLLSWHYRGQTSAARETAQAVYDETHVARDDIRRGWTAYALAEVLIDLDHPRADRLLQEALTEATSHGDRYLHGVTLVAAAALRGRYGSVGEAVAGFIDVIDHWRALGDWLHQWSTLRNVEQLLVRANQHGDAALLHGAIQARADRFPIFGQDAERQVRLGQQLHQQLGDQEFTDRCARGRTRTDLEVVELARRALSSVTT